MPSPANQFYEGDEIYLIKYKGNDLVTDYTKSYIITNLVKEKCNKEGNITKMATLDNGTIHVLYFYSLYSLSNQGVTYYAEKKKQRYYYLCCLF